MHAHAPHLLHWVLLTMLVSMFCTACTLDAPVPDAQAPVPPPATPTPQLPQDTLRVQALIPNLRAADTVTLFYQWEGFNERAPYRVQTTLHLLENPIQSMLTISVGGLNTDVITREYATELTEPQYTSAVALLQTIPVIEGVYQPTFMHTDDYPLLSMTFTINGEIITFRSRSQGAEHLPWQLIIRDTSYVILSDDIFTVWKIFQPTMKPEELEALINS